MNNASDQVRDRRVFEKVLWVAQAFDKSPLYMYLCDAHPLEIQIFWF